MSKSFLVKCPLHWMGVWIRTGRMTNRASANPTPKADPISCVRKTVDAPMISSSILLRERFSGYI